LKRPCGKIGKDTVESIRIGCSYGIGGLCDRIVQEIRSSSKKTPFLVVATGGYARFMSRYCRSIQKIDESLMMKGIWLAYRNFVKKSLDKKS
jgi:pantothenate kinase type III